MRRKSIVCFLDKEDQVFLRKEVENKDIDKIIRAEASKLGLPLVKFKVKNSGKVICGGWMRFQNLN